MNSDDQESCNAWAVATTEVHPKTLWPNSLKQRSRCRTFSCCIQPSNFLIKDLIMNAKTLFAAAFVAIGTITTLGAGSAFAGEATYEYPVAYTSTVSRAAVQAEALRARAAGLIVQGEQSVVIADNGPALSRAQVKAELREAVRIGAISRGEQDLVPTAAQLASIRMAGEKAAAMTMASR
jgi:hypothetical protein